MQEYTEEITRGSVLGGRRLGELQLIISVQDPERSRMVADGDGISRKKSAVYTGALLDRLQVLNSGRPHGYMAWWKLSVVHADVHYQKHAGPSWSLGFMKI